MGCVGFRQMAELSGISKLWHICPESMLIIPFTDFAVAFVYNRRHISHLFSPQFWQELVGVIEEINSSPVKYEDILQVRIGGNRENCAKSPAAKMSHIVTLESFHLHAGIHINEGSSDRKRLHELYRHLVWYE